MSAIAEPPATPPAAPAAPPANTPPSPLPPPPGAFTAAALAKARTPKEPAPAAPPTPAAPAAPPAPAPVPTNNAPASPPPATPPATPATPPATPPPAAEPELPEHFSHANAGNWKKARDLIKELETKTKTYADQLKAKDEEIVKFKSKPQVDPEFQAKHEALQKERDEYHAIVERNAMADDPRFKARYDAPIERALTNVKTLAGDKGERLTALLSAPDGKWRQDAIEEVTADLTPLTVSRIGAAIEKYEELRGERTTMLADSKTQMAQAREVDAKTKAERESKAAAAREHNVNYALQKAREVDAFKPIEGDATHNEAVAANEAALKKFLTAVGTKDMTLDDFIQAPIQAAESKRLKGVVEALTKERDELKKAVAEFQGANPGMRGGGAVTAPGGETVKTPYGESRFVADAMSRIRGK